MYCYNCGKKINEKAVVCVNCGVSTKNIQSDSKGTAGFVLGIIGLLLVFGSFRNIMVIYNSTYDSTTFAGNIIEMFIPFCVIIPGFISSRKSKNIQKNGFNSAGFVLNLIAICIGIFSLFIINS